MTTYNSDSAKRTAERIVDFLGLPHRIKRDADIAAIIEEITRVGEKEEALKKMVAFLLEWQDTLAGVQMTLENFKRDSGLQEAQTALADKPETEK